MIEKDIRIMRAHLDAIIGFDKMDKGIDVLRAEGVDVSKLTEPILKIASEFLNLVSIEAQKLGTDKDDLIRELIEKITEREENAIK